MSRSKLPFIKFFPADWLRDTRRLSRVVKGDWIDLLCAMWDAPQRGRLDWTLETYALHLGITMEEAERVLRELLETGTADGEFRACNAECNANVTHGNGHVTLISRKMVKEYDHYNRTKDQTLARVRKFRERKKGAGNADVTRKTSDVISVSSHKNEKDTDMGVSVEQVKNPKELVDAWNDWFKDDLPGVSWPLAPSRLRKALARLREHREATWWEEVFKKILDSPFLLGVNGSWRITFDWLIDNDRNSVKVWEGQYEKKAGHGAK